ncbi:TPA: hypothetical protein LS291_004678, partial [Serratia marcescens]|nr:hypothetical protein [Serratia marcescens]
MTLRDVFDEYIKLIHSMAYEKSKSIGKIIDEPSFISSFVENHKTLEELLNKNHSQKYYIIDAVYTHQTPKVTPTKSKISVEIADLLIINTHHSASQPNTVGNAMLFQAKRHSSPKTGSLAAENEKTQFHLYKEWPTFTFKTRKLHFNGPGCQWNFNLKKDTDLEHSKYIVIYDDTISTNQPGELCQQFINAKFIDNSPWNSSACEGSKNQPSQGLTCEESFSATLEKIISGTNGRHFDTSENVANDHWSNFIQRMMELAVGGVYTYNLIRQDIKKRNRFSKISSSFLYNTAELVLRHEINEILNLTNYSIENKPWFYYTNI